VGIEYSAGFTAALAGAAQAQVGWGRCLQAHGHLLTVSLPHMGSLAPGCL